MPRQRHGFESRHPHQILSALGRTVRQRAATSRNAVRLRERRPFLSGLIDQLASRLVCTQKIGVQISVGPPSFGTSHKGSAPASEAGPCRFESYRADHLDVAERTLRRSSKSVHAGSSPAVETIRCDVCLTARRSALNREIGVRFSASQPIFSPWQNGDAPAS